MKQQKKLFVKTRYNGFRLDLFLLATRALWASYELDRSIIQRLITAQKIIVNGHSARPSYRVHPGEAVTILSEELPTEEATHSDLPTIPILYEDQHLLVIDKPAGLTVHPSRSDQKGTLVDWIITQYPEIKKVGENALRPGIVHRLDKETSGIIVLVKSTEAFLALKRLFQTRAVEKTYTALVYGLIKEKKGVIKTPIGRIEKSHLRGTPFKKRVFAGNLRPSVTEYELLTTYPQYSLLSIKPKTGRTHQIRVHMASIGHPIVGDRIYRFKRHRKDSLDPPHQLLHAAGIGFDLFGKRYEFYSPLPEYFITYLEKCS